VDRNVLSDIEVSKAKMDSVLETFLSETQGQSLSACPLMDQHRTSLNPLNCGY